MNLPVHQSSSNALAAGAPRSLAAGAPRSLAAGALSHGDNSLPSPPGESVSWQTAMKRAIRTAGELQRYVGLREDDLPSGCEAFPTFVPLELARRIRPGDPDDPILRQVLPVSQEMAPAAGFVSDPVGDLPALAAQGILHKYDGRALIITTGACAVHCRYCFRREFPYSDAGSRALSWQPSLQYLTEHEDITEVLLSGGDPLTLQDDALFGLIGEIESIHHVQRLRIHTRLPIAIPQRITPPLVERLRDSRLTVWTVIHSNHPAELDEAVFAATDRLIDGGIPVLNQSVLLAGVNDDAETLESLSRRLIDHRIQPYYLHQLDQVRGASHFWVPPDMGIRLIEHLRSVLPGYAVPTFVAEHKGQPSKTPLTRQSLDSIRETARP
ncbi:EF-P beta-lysylation protein EpmB [Stieleria varia]|uniref:L-lysine 2,3-aminomutase n=1 Tax=Stieleria varia TaxID=2528005 RepID=A0A5C6B1A0_9BACT|nr:EF-P beta-lysylation protein EpmB [Stieleria varia]TWU05650.1 L-lysine 2,3-aminomutase [Stieleria varia]